MSFCWIYVLLYIIYSDTVCSFELAAVAALVLASYYKLQLILGGTVSKCTEAPHSLDLFLCFSLQELMFLSQPMTLTEKNKHHDQSITFQLYKYSSCLHITRCLDSFLVSSLTCGIARFQYEKIKKFVANAKSEGATILTGGVRPKVIPSSLMLVREQLFTFY